MAQREVYITFVADAGKQEEFVRDRYKVPYRAVFAGVGSGKTILGVWEDVMWCLENPGIVGYVFEPTYKMVRRTLIPTLEHPLILGKPIESNPAVKEVRVGDGCIVFKRDSHLWFGSLEEPEYAEGPNVDFVHVDEAQYVRRFGDAWEVILRRLRGTGRHDETRQGAWITTTPPALIMGDPLFDFFENPETRNPHSKVYRWSMMDNPHTPQRWKEGILATHHDNLAKRFIDGVFAPAGIGSFNYDSTIHELKEDFDPAVIRSVVYGVDFGWTNPSAIVAVGFDGDDRAYILDEFYQNRVQTETLVEELKEMQRTWGSGSVICDSSQPQTIDLLCKAGLVASGNKTRREDGIAELGGRFHVQGDGRPRVYVHKSCVNWVHEVMVYDENVKENDHAVDASRYAIMNRAATSTLDVSFSKVRM